MEIWQQFKHSDVDLFIGKDLNKYSTFKLKSIGNIAIIKSIAALKLFGEFLNVNQIKFAILGLGANQILHNGSDNFIYLKLAIDNNIEQLSFYKDIYSLPASINLNHLTNTAKKFNLKGWEVFTGVPATLGGAVAMNAGTSLGEIGDLIDSVTILKNFKEIKTIKLSKNDFIYRGNKFLSKDDIILKIDIKHFGIDNTISNKIDDYLSFRKKTQPWLAKSCGCVYKNYSNLSKVGQLVDLLGLKELECGGIKVSPVHGNFFENFNSGSIEDFIALKDTVDCYCQRFYGIKFELEVKF